jgi:hypothetical protein
MDRGCSRHPPMTFAACSGHPGAGECDIGARAVAAMLECKGCRLRRLECWVEQIKTHAIRLRTTLGRGKGVLSTTLAKSNW